MEDHEYEVLGSEKPKPQATNETDKPSKKRKKKRSGKVKFSVRFEAFLIGLVVGLLLMIIQPWNYISGFASNRESAVAVSDKADDILEINDEKDSTKAVVTINYLKELTESASDLITTKYFYKDAKNYKNTKKLFNKDLPFTTDEVVYTYEGIISLGIDVSKIGFSVNNTNKEIEVSLPDIKIIANEIDADSFEYITAKDSVFNDTDMENYTTLLAGLKKEKAEKVMGDKDLLDDAKHRSKAVIRELIEKSDLAADYSVIFE